MLADEVKIDLKKTSENIKTYMKQQNLTRSDLGRKTGLTRGCISNYTNGYNPPSLVNLGVLAEALGVNISEIVVYKKEGEQTSEEVNSETIKRIHN